MRRLWINVNREAMDCIVLAAGRGTRMKSRLAKVLHPIAGRPILHYPVRAALDAGASIVVVVCSEDSRSAISASLNETFGAGRVECQVQPEPRGTGDAARIGIELCSAELIGILCGDTPLIDAEVLRALIHGMDRSRAALIVQSCTVKSPEGYGRIVRDSENRMVEIREHRDLRDEKEREINEVNAGIYFGRRGDLTAALSRLVPNNDQGEYYLTDVVADIAKSSSVVAQAGNADVLIGVNDRGQLVEAEVSMYRRIALRHCLAGVTVRDGTRIEDCVQIAPDTQIESGVTLRGCTTIGEGATIDVGCVITDSSIGRNASIKPYCIIEKSSVGEAAQIGPFARLRPESIIEDAAHIGNFVETKKTIVRRGAKANHLAYLGDGDIGEGANVGAGTIFCNYDGYRKHKTFIGANAFIGSDSQLVAPVTVGAGAYVASGTTVTKDVPDGSLAISRVRQENKLDYATQLRTRLAAEAGKKD